TPQLAELVTIARSVPCVFSPNMSVGVNVLLKVVAEMARTFKDDYDIEVTEAHHRLKKDAPSGTALKLAKVLAEATGKDFDSVATDGRKGIDGERQQGESGMEVMGAGVTVGEETVLRGGRARGAGL